MSRVYFPYLERYDGISPILDVAQLRAQKQALIAADEKYINDRFRRQVENVNLMHDIYNQRKMDFNYIEEGIRGFHIVLHPKYNFNVLLDVIFKLIHCTKDVPFMKHNAGKRQDAVYKLYADRTSKSGRKIPYLSKGDILKLTKTIGRKKSVSVYIEHSFVDPANPRHRAHNSLLPIVCEFENDGSIMIQGSFRHTFTIKEIEGIIKNAANPVINVVKNYVEQSGYSVDEFSTLYDENVEIIDLNYFSQLSITKNIEIKNMIGCISSMFNEIEGSLRKGIVLRYKRVSNYNEMNSQEAYIIEMLNKNGNDRDIVEGLKQNFMMTDEEALMKIAALLSSIQTMQNAHHRGGKIKVKNNPGFITKITKSQFTNNIAIEVNNITNVLYLCTIPLYLDSVLRIYQDPGTTGVPLQRIQQLCRGSPTSAQLPPAQMPDVVEPVNVTSTVVADSIVKVQQEKEVEEVQDIVAAFHEPFPESVAASIRDEEVVFGIEKEKGDKVKVDIFDLLFDDDDDEDDVNEGDDEDDNEITISTTGDVDEHSGGAGEKTMIRVVPKEIVTDITGMDIANPNPFHKRLDERDPSLFLVQDDGKFNAYSRSCPWNYRRQPVILTDEEKARIDAEHPGSYDQSIKYGSSPDNQHWYICPRYWSLKHNTSLTEEEVKSGKYGGIIPAKAKVVPKGANIFEFTDDTYHTGENGEYKQHYPGFLKKDAHPKGMCVPCCFSHWDKPAQKKRRQECLIAEYEKVPAVDEPTSRFEPEQNTLTPIPQSADVAAPPPTEATTSSIAPPDAVKDDRILSSDKFPLDNNRWGYMPIQMQKFLFNDNRKCQVSVKNQLLQKNTPCLLRRGVESSSTQSFLSAIAYIYAEYKDETSKKSASPFPVPSIKQMQAILIQSLTLDSFISLQNGTLVETFYDEKTTVELSGYQKTTIYQSLMPPEGEAPSRARIALLKRAINAYENFKTFLGSREDVVIDHTYLWDMVCKPNSRLFQGGNNLVILNLPDDDITNNVQVLCPTNAHSGETFEVRRKTTILMKKHGYYEPIYMFENKGKRIEAYCRFSLLDKNLSSKMRHILETIKTMYYGYCRLHPSMPGRYHFQMNKPANRIAKLMKNAGFTVVCQVLNYAEKVIGFVAEKMPVKTAATGSRSIMRGFIPTAASPPITVSQTSDVYEYDVKYMDDESLWMDYKSTVEFLTYVSTEVRKSTKETLHCLPKLKVVEDGLIVGVITETNQFVQTTVSSESNNVEDDLPTILDMNYNEVDKELQSSNEVVDVDMERVRYIKNIRLETNFYNVFRNTARVIMNKPENKGARDEINSVSTAPQIRYLNKLDRLTGLLQRLLSKEIGFTDYGEDALARISQISKCDCDGKTKQEYCMKEVGGLCKLLLPKNNLTNANIKNDTGYYRRLADELIRYERVRMFVFEPMKYLTFSEIKYNLNEDEIILLESLLTQDYFEDLVPAMTNPYAKHSTFITAQPKEVVGVSQQYDNTYNATYINAVKKQELDDEMALDVGLRNKQPGKTMVSSEFAHAIDSCGDILVRDMTPKMRGYFGMEARELIFSGESQECSFDIILTMLRRVDVANAGLTIKNIKTVLSMEYGRLIAANPGFDKKIVSLINAYGMKVFADNISIGRYTLDQLLFSEHYFLTPLDLWILSRHYYIPLVLVSSTTLMENGRPAMVCFSIQKTSEGQSYFFVKVPIFKQMIVPRYSLIESGEEIYVPIGNVKEEMKGMIDMQLDADVPYTIESFVGGFKLSNIKQRKQLVEVAAPSMEEFNAEQARIHGMIEESKRQTALAVSSNA
jgi:hypothetical protein